MPNWNDIETEILDQAVSTPFDSVRRKYLRQLHERTGRNVIVYYSGWLQKPALVDKYGYTGFPLQDSDKNGLMATIHQLDRNKGLDLFLHTSGGDIAATESLVDYLRTMFKGDIRAIVPQLAMSAGTMIALSCKQVLMGKHSSLGPIDPQIGGLPAHAIIEEFEQAADDLLNNRPTVPFWQLIIGKYPPTLIGECQKAIKWCDDMVLEWLVSGMFADKTREEAEICAKRILEELGSHETTKTHSRHISMQRAQELGINVLPLEDDNDLQNDVLTIHHACIQTLSSTPTCKIIENHNGIAYMDTFDVS